MRMLAAALSLTALAACATGGDVTLAFAEDPPSRVRGNVVTLDLEAGGIEIVPADGDTSGETGHFHVFVDREPVDEGEVIPREAGVVHSAENPVVLYGLSPGEHTLTVVLGDGAHRRLREDVELGATVEVEGPSVDGSAPATIEEGDDVAIGLKAEGVEIVAADGERSEETGHFHVLVDPSDPPEAGGLIPAPEPNRIVHTVTDEVTISGLDRGEHTIWVVLGDGQHYAFDPPVMDRLTVTVE
jgi:hypothetical protein